MAFYLVTLQWFDYAVNPTVFNIFCCLAFIDYFDVDLVVILMKYFYGIVTFTFSK